MQFFVANIFNPLCKYPEHHMKHFILLALIALHTTTALAQTTKFTQLYTKAYKIAATYPDSAIHYARLALQSTSKPQEQATAHDLWGFYAVRQGYYSMALEHYQQAYNLYSKPLKKSMMLDNLAVCYKNIGNVKMAIPIFDKAVLKFSQIEDSVRIAESLYFLSDCYLAVHNLQAADSTLRLAIKIGERLQHSKLGVFYNSYAYYQEKMNRFDSAVYYQKRAIQRDVGKDLAKKSILFSDLARLYLQSDQKDLARKTLKKAETLANNQPKALLHCLLVKGMLLFLDKKDEAAYQSYVLCDSILKQLRQEAGDLVQQQYTRKKSHEMHKTGYEFFMRVFSDSDRPRIVSIRQWYQDRMYYEKALFDNIKFSVALKDSLAIERARTQPKVQVNRVISPWWWVALAIVVLGGAVLVYDYRAKALEAHTNFVEAVEINPIKGFDKITKQEVKRLERIETLTRRKLKTDDIKILVMIGRGYNYNQIALASDLKVGTIKTRVKRLKDKCEVDNIRDLMQG